LLQTPACHAAPIGPILWGPPGAASRMHAWPRMTCGQIASNHCPLPRHRPLRYCRIMGLHARSVNATAFFNRLPPLCCSLSHTLGVSSLPPLSSPRPAKSFYLLTPCPALVLLLSLLLAAGLLILLIPREQPPLALHNLFHLLGRLGIFSSFPFCRLGRTRLGFGMRSGGARFANQHREEQGMVF
jgi:hypothetical protein